MTSGSQDISTETWRMNEHPSGGKRAGRKRKEKSTYKGPGGKSSLACLSFGMLSVAGNRKLKWKWFKNKKNIMSLPRVRSLAVGIPGLVNSMAQACLEIFSLLRPYHPLGLGLPCWVGLSSGPQDGPKMVSHVDGHMPVLEREKASPKGRLSPQVTLVRMVSHTIITRGVGPLVWIHCIHSLVGMN